MHYYKLLLLLLFIFIVPIKGTPVKTVTVAHDIPETLNGKVRQLIEIRPAINTENPQLCPYDTTNFDTTGNSLETRVGNGQKVCIVYNYTNRYNIDNKKVEMIKTLGNSQITYAFGDEDKILGSKKEDVRILYEYTSHNDVEEMKVFHGTRFSFFKKTFKYNDEKLLIETNTYYKDPKMVEKCVYRYLTFDDRKNWLERIATYTNDGNTTKRETIRRKIAYFK